MSNEALKPVGDKSPNTPSYDPIEFTRIMIDVMQRAEPIIREVTEKYATQAKSPPIDPMNMQEAYVNFMNAIMDDPQTFAGLQMEYWDNWNALVNKMSSQFLGEDDSTDPLFKPENGDRRFKSPLWKESAFFDFIQQSYLMTSSWMRKVIYETKGLDSETVSRLDFYTRQFVDAMAPTNFILTNPEVLKETIESRGDNLIRGLENLLEDIKKAGSSFQISTTDYKAFELGKNIATTEGKVIYQNELMQLIQYTASTKKVFRTPLLIVPPWINKYYILDLQQKNSFIKWLVDQGHTVFTISWVNPTPSLSEKTFDHYMLDGILAALDKIEETTGEKTVNAIGYCLGGTLLSIALSYLDAKKQADKIQSATLLTTLIDFENAGELKLFMDEKTLDLLDQQMSQNGIMMGKTMQKTFSLLRANDLVWGFVVNNYLMGREPFPFDLLYWNEDSTNMPAKMHNFYLRNMYQHNRLIEDGGIEIDKTSINMKKIKTPCYFLSTREDHIAPWQATYSGSKLLQGPVTFTLAASGHIAGVVNPPDNQKYCFWHSNKLPNDPNNWLESAQQKDGSWWPHWQNWITAYAGTKITKRKIVKSIEAAPGSYVKIRS